MVTTTEVPKWDTYTDIQVFFHGIYIEMSAMGNALHNQAR